MTSLNNRIALVTGGSRGIGRAVAETLLRAGARVAICGRNPESLEETVNALSPLGEIRGTVADVALQSDVEQLFRFVDSNFSGLDILINNAGLGIFRSVADLTPDQWRRVVETNLHGAYYCAHEAVTRFRQRGGGSVINISSLAGKNPFAGGAAYNASKFGLNGFAEAMMLDHRHDNIRVSTIMPGSVDTGFSLSASAGWKIAAADIAQIVLTILEMPERTLISRVEVRPSRPPR
jgi:NAD(P)-dependent dehydrogenase (short-subunit alcohol dehydrogenase family)